MKNLKIFARIFLSHTFIAFISVSVFSVIFYVLVGDALLQRTVDQLSSINILKKTQIENYFRYTRESLDLLQKNEAFLKDIATIDDKTGALHPGDHFIDKIKSLEQFAGFNRIFLVDEAFRRVAGSRDTFLLESFKNRESYSHYHLTDVSYLNHGGKSLLLHIMPLVIDSRTIGYMIIEDDISEIQNILLETTGMGNTGESYIVGHDLMLRTTSRFLPTVAPLTIKVGTASMDSVSAAYKKHIKSDYRGVKVLSYSRRINSPLSWIIVSEIDFNEAMTPVVKFRNYLVLLVIGLMLVIVVITYFLSNTISSPIVSLSSGIIKLSKGVIPEKESVKNNDEIGQMTTAVNTLIDGLERTAAFANQIGRGSFEASFQALSDDDMLGKALIDMRNQLKEFNLREIRLVREKASAVLEAQENERKRFVLDLHDGVGQLLTAVRLRVERMEKDDSVTELISMINETIAEIKRVSYNLMPNALVDFGLEAALKGLCDDARRYSAIAFDFQYVKEGDGELDFDVSIAVFRIVQEALNNVLKHAGASQVDLHVIEKNDELYCLLRDNGRGFDQTTRQGKGFGLTTMRERSRMLNGSFEIDSDLNGTVIEAHIPINQ